MKKTAAIISACMLTFALSACSGSNYVMHTNDGRTIVSDGKPQTDNDTGMISYKDANGNKQQINRTDVKEMVECRARAEHGKWKGWFDGDQPNCKHNNTTSQP